MRIYLLVLIMTGATLSGQTKEGDRWVDNNLTLRIIKDEIRSSGEFAVCVVDTVDGPCIENLVTGMLVKVYGANDELLWEGQGSGRSKRLKLPKAMPRAQVLELEAFKPFVTNKSTGTHIHQDEVIHVKYRIQ